MGSNWVHSFYFTANLNSYHLNLTKLRVQVGSVYFHDGWGLAFLFLLINGSGLGWSCAYYHCVRPNSLPPMWGQPICHTGKKTKYYDAFVEGMESWSYVFLGFSTRHAVKQNSAMSRSKNKAQQGRWSKKSYNDRELICLHGIECVPRNSKKYASKSG